MNTPAVTAEAAETVARAVFTALPDAVIGVGEDGIIQMANEQAERLFGYTASELVGLPVEALVPVPLQNAHKSHRRRYAEFPRTRAMGLGLRLEARRKDGTQFPTDIALSAIPFGADTLFVAAVRDVSEQWAWSERERLQAEFHRSQRLESLGQLAAGVAHDFNNLLAIIVNYTAFAVDALSDDPPTDPTEAADLRRRTRDDLEQVKHAALRAAELTRQLMLFGRAQPVSPERLDVAAALGELEKLLHRTIGENVRLAVRSHPELWSVDMDRTQFDQVVLNLVVNARDAMLDGGTVDIEASNVIDREREPSRWVRIVVSDTGPGMTSDVAARAFEPFFTTKAPGEGTGLGLATVYGAVSQAHGTVRLDTVSGLGAAFVIDLPAADQDDAREEPTPVASSKTPRVGGTILVAEDEAGVREIVVRVLGRAGYHVIVTASAAEAIAVLDDDAVEVDLVLTDVVMPGGSGRELREWVHASRPDIRVVYMSGYTPPSDADDDAIPVLAKPFTAAALLGAVNAALDHAP